MSKPKKPKYREKGKNTMDVRRVTISQETQTRLATQASGISRNHKHQLRINAVRQYIDSQPTGIPIKIEYIIQSAGYDVKDPKEYSRGWTFINKAVEKNEIYREKIPNSHQSYWWNPENPTVKKLRSVEVEQREEPKPVEKVIETKTTEKPIESIPTPSKVVENNLPVQAYVQPASESVLNLAKEFAWHNNSDSLREFVTWLQTRG